MTYEELKKANKNIKTMTITRWDKKLGKEISKEYASVNERVNAFRSVFPDGFIMTDIVSHVDGIIVMVAKVGYYMEDGSLRILGTGTSYESEDSSVINRTSYIENCETSAVGRALGMAGFGIVESIASADEMASAIMQQNAPQAAKAEPKAHIKYECANCHKLFTDATWAKKSHDRWGKYVCKSCVAAKKAAMEKAQELEPMPEPIPEPMPIPEAQDELELPFTFD